MSSNEIVTEPEYLRSVGTFDSLSSDAIQQTDDKQKDDESPMKKVLGRITEGAAAIFTCGKTSDVESSDKKGKSTSDDSIYE